MMKYLSLPFILGCTLALGPAAIAQERVTLSIRDVIERPAVLYDAQDASSGVVFVPQSGLQADSWAQFASQLKSQGMMSLALNYTSEEDVSTAIKFLLSRGVQEITLIGGSIGGASVLKVLNKNEFPEVKRAVLLGTGEGNSSDSQGVEKLFIVAENDMFAGLTHSSHRKASEPKELVIFPGAQHGQELFNGIHKDALEELLLAFLSD